MTRIGTYLTPSAPRLRSPQAIWFSTTRIGCAVGSCPGGVQNPSGGGVLPGVFAVCHYAVPGNVDYGDNTFAKNVLPLQPWAPRVCA